MIENIGEKCMDSQENFGKVFIDQIIAFLMPLEGVERRPITDWTAICHRATVIWRLVSKSKIKWFTRVNFVLRFFICFWVRWDERPEELTTMQMKNERSKRQCAVWIEGWGCSCMLDYISEVERKVEACE